MGNTHAKAQPDAEIDSTVAANASKDGNIITQTPSSDAAHHDGDDTNGRKRRSRTSPTNGQSRTATSVASPTTKCTELQQSQNGGGVPVIQTRDDENLSQSWITEDQVVVNFAMSDLMAYLQVVANNSSQLPVTQRDDPELDHSVNNLSSEEYARKSAAFVPADVRVIGGVFTKYGQVWDLPSSEEYQASDGAQEPGRSYGGACTNSMLKVLYDATNDAGDGDDADETDALFDDDDEDDDDESAWGKSFKSGFSLDNGIGITNTISWAELMRKMANEMREIEYPQTLKITTSRKMDLNNPFSFVPENFIPSSGKKRALLIGCNYTNLPGAELKASHDDIRSMKDYIVNVHGFPETKELMTTLLDDGEHDAPTFMNIVGALKTLSEESQPGDVVFVQFSGHGSRFLDAHNDDTGSYDEAIIPCDYKQSGIIRDTLVFKTLLAPMRYGVTVTIMIDCCDNGMILDLPYAWSPSMKQNVDRPQLVVNDDFSFVRFLKVVKTLYDSSSFTLLGKTVGTALNLGLQAADTELSDADLHVVEETEKQRRNIVMSQGSILDALADACRGPQKKSNRRGDASRPTLLEQAMSCTCMNPDDEYFSDDESDAYKTRTEEESEAVQESFESLTDDEVDFETTSKRRRSRGGRSRRR